MKRYLTGIKSTGMPHLGNLLGAIKPAINFSNTKADAQFIYFIADYHSLTGLKNPALHREYAYEIAAAWLACGLDPNKAILYKQSDIPEIFELNWMLACHTPKGDLNRAHSYKAALAANLEKGEDEDHGVNTGLYTYPVLMAADILLFDTDFVPVGKDQVQHIEIARSIAQRMNQLYGNILKEPKELLDGDSAYIVGLDGRKMSKSYDNHIPIFLAEKKMQKMINRIVTDSTGPTEPKKS
jgi:tryptophanyl-tRNA synthetase